MQFIVSFSGTLITWRKNGLLLNANTKYRFDSTRKRLTINTPSKSEEGQYTCISTMSGSQVSASGQLRVIGKNFSVIFI